MSEFLVGAIIGFMAACIFMASIVADTNRSRCESGLTFLVDKTVYQCVKFEASPSTTETKS